MKSAPMNGTYTLNRKTIFVSVTVSINGGNPTVRTTTPLPDIARGYWHVNNGKINQCELLAAVDNGVIKGIWEIDKNFGWKPMAINSISTRNLHSGVIEPKRKYCKVLSPVERDLVNKPLSIINGMKRMYGPVRYNF